MRKILMLVVVLIAVGCAEQVEQAEQVQVKDCTKLSMGSPDVRACADQGNASAQHYLGTMYNDGEGVPEDDVEAARWYRLAAEEQDYAPAQFSLGVMYDNGEGVPEDDVVAYMWWNLAAAQGQATARENKDLIEKRMTREQIAEGQRMSREWVASHPPE